MILVPGIVSAMTLTGIVLAPLVPPMVHAPPASWHPLALTFALTTAGTACSLWATNLLAISAAWQRTELSAVARLTGQLTEVVTIVASLVAGGGVVALGTGSVAGAVCTFAIAVGWTTARWRSMTLPRPRFDRTELWNLTQATVPLMVSRIVLQVASNVQVALVSATVSPAAAAIYALTDRVMSIASNFINPIAGSVLSGFAHLVGERGVRAAIRPARELLGVWSLAVASMFPTLLALNHDFTILWIGSGNYGGLALNVALCFAAILGAREWVMSMMLLSAGAIRASAWTATAEAALKLPIMYLALRTLGTYGIPVAAGTISLVALFVWSTSVARRLEIDVGERKRFHLTGTASVVVTSGFGVIEAIVLPVAASWASLIAKAAVLGALHVGIAIALGGEGRAAVFERLVRRRSAV
jgi:O-antigen/teichoic acid export membrane protein